MSDAADRLARSRLAIIEQVQRRERRPERGESRGEQARAQREPARERPGYDGPGEGWWGGIRHALSTWWRHHPAHMGVELATPLLSSYARRKPMQFLAISAALGAAVVVARPWRLISATGLLVALLKSSQVTGLLVSALSAADFERDHRPPE